MIATFDLRLYALLINHISYGITSAEQLPRFHFFKLICQSCARIYNATEGGRRRESEASSRRNVSLVWKIKQEWRKKRKVMALSNARLMSAHFNGASSY